LNQGLVDADEEEAVLRPEEIEEKNKYELWDLSRPLDGDCEIDFCTIEDKDGKTVFWHSSAHILGSALEHTYGSHLCIGPPLEEGFYYDTYMGKNVIDEKDYEKIEKEAQKVITSNLPYSRLTLTKEEALNLFGENPFKVQLISNKIPDNGKTTAYKCGDLIDLCLGPHLSSTGVVKSFKITKNSSCYWLAKADNDSLQRVYGITFNSKVLMEEYIKRKEEEEKRDHRNIGKQQDLFMFHQLSPGSTFFYPSGAHIYNKLIDFMRREYTMRGFHEVISPNIFNLKLWKTSGHYKNYKENMFMVKIENQGFGLKPMNCPGHCLMFDSKARSYKELPIRYADFGVLHRNELSGALSGLTRVRRFAQDDAHIFCTPEQIQSEIFSQLQFVEYVYSVFGFEYELFLSTRPEKALGSVDLWDKAEKALADALNQFGKPWKINPGDGAFYGPKIDIKLFDAIKRTHQCGTIQLDFQLPIRFNLHYRTDEVVIKSDADKEAEKKEAAEARKKAKADKKADKKAKKEGGENAVENNNEKNSNENQKEITKEISCCNRDVFPNDEWDDEEFIWEEVLIFSLFYL
jgi:threonyl-tRNA synthetase